MQNDLNKLQSDVFHVARLQHDAAIAAIEAHKKATQTILDTKPNTDAVINIAKAHSEQIRNVETTINKFRQDTLAAISKVSEALNGSKDQFVGKSLYDMDMDVIQKNTEQLSLQYQKLREDMQMQARDLINKLKIELDNFRKEVAAKPSEIATFKEEVGKRMNDAEYHAKGAVANIKTYDHRFLIIEKHIESIYLMLKGITSQKQ